MEHTKEAAVLGGTLFLGLVLGGWMLGSQIKAIKLADRYVAVRGLAERNVKSDLAIWTLTVSASGDDYASVLHQAADGKDKTVAFLTSAGIQQNEIAVASPDVTDKQAREYGNNDKGPRYLVSQQVVVTSPRVDAVSAANAKTASLLDQGVMLGRNQVQYKFSSLNSIKPDMISEATKNAREAAERFAADSGSKVGAIRSASQGQFSISAPNEGGAEPNPYGGDNGDSSMMKKVRVVTSTDYYLEK
ncbi:MAG: SIMPL domain-containing protein [Acidobacteria bacterium]|nr:SIMPL domain-containing protein [Acidobacteriota bacterium]